MLSLLINIFSPHTRVSRLVVHRNGGGPEQRTHTQHSSLAMDDPLKQKVSYPREVTTGEYGLYTWGWGDFGVLGNDGCRPMPEPVNVAMNCPTTPALHESSDMAVACGPSRRRSTTTSRTSATRCSPSSTTSRPLMSPPPPASRPLDSGALRRRETS